MMMRALALAMNAFSAGINLELAELPNNPWSVVNWAAFALSGGVTVWLVLKLSHEGKSQ